MKRFLLRLAAFVLLYLVVISSISTLFPYYWGNPWYGSKIKYLENEGFKKHNTYFIGSSRFYRQINPLIFDTTLNQQTGDVVVSFNLGAPATFTPQTYYLYENFLNSKLAESTKYCFLELTEVDNISADLIDEERSSYWITTKEFKFAITSFLKNKNITQLKKARNISHYLVSFFKSLFHIGHFGQQITEDNYYSPEYLGSGQNGYYPLEEQLDFTTNSNVRNNLLKRNKSILNNSEIIERRREESVASYNMDGVAIDQIQLQRINHLINKSKEKGIHLFLVLSPRSKVPELIRLGNSLSKDHFIDLSNPNKYPELYQPEYSFDVGHLNTKGSEIYSRLLA